MVVDHYLRHKGETLRFDILGPLEVRDADGAAVRLPGGRARALLALLCVNADRVVSRDRLIEALWDGVPPASATTRLQGFVSDLRRALPDRPDAVIHTSGGGYLLVAADDEIDLGRARGLIAQARVLREKGDVEAAVARMADALALWRGPAFDGIECMALQAEAATIEGEYVDGLEQLAELELSLGRHGVVVGRLTEWAARYPLREGLQGSLMRALAGSGRQSEAITAYHRLRGRLAEELGVDPAPHLQELYASILSGDRDVVAPLPTKVPRPAQLPADTADFIGRGEQARELGAALVPGTGAPVAVALSAVSGAGGIGKTALALHVAHLVAASFPDGQLYVNLAGTSGDPPSPGDVLARLLRDLGVAADDVPADEAERAARYRSLLTGRRVLLVLDDARGAAQVRPLLPGAAGCAVLVTSRAGLADLSGARHVDLDVMPEVEARELLRLIVGPARVAAEPAAVDRLVRACAGLPLAIRIAGAKLASRPGWSIETFARKLSAERLRLAELKVGDLAVRASFQLSYDTLDDDLATAFRMLGLAAIPAFGAGQVAALCDVDAERAERLLEGLADVHMLQSPAFGVYRFHDLLRLFATELADAQVSRDESDRGIGRLHDWYACTLRAACLQLVQGRSMPPEAEPMPATDVPAFATHRAAVEWCQAQYPALEWVIAEAARRNRAGLAANVACLLWMYVTRAVVPHSHVTSQRVGLECARALGVEPVQAWLLNGLGAALARTGDADGAVETYRQSLDLRRRLGDDAGRAATLNNIANVRHYQGRYADAVEHYLAAAAIAESGGRRDHQAAILENAANSYREMGAYVEALAAYRSALEIHDSVGSLYGVAGCRSGIADTLHRLGRSEESLAQHECAMAIYRELGNV
ncbi:MAG TPA: BTAD domain-containing putative transcriptional regulator, partial [Rugosimonospora sp.]